MGAGHDLRFWWGRVCDECAVAAALLFLCELAFRGAGLRRALVRVGRAAADRLSREARMVGDRFSASARAKQLCRTGCVDSRC